jgi:hypothetical protein
LARIVFGNSPWTLFFIEGLSPNLTGGIKSQMLSSESAIKVMSYSLRSLNTAINLEIILSECLNFSTWSKRVGSSLFYDRWWMTTVRLDHCHVATLGWRSLCKASPLYLSSYIFTEVGTKLSLVKILARKTSSI